jgi:hypothetical protein
MQKILKDIFVSVASKIIVICLCWLGAAVFPVILASGVIHSPLGRELAAGISGFSLGALVCGWISQQICKRYGKLVVIEARWGSDDLDSDITSQISNRISNNKLRVPQVNNTAMGVQDPDFGKPKNLTVTYSFTGRERKMVVRENDPDGLKLP